MRAFQTISYKIVEPPPNFQFICPCFPPSPLVNVAVPQRVAESRVSSRSGTFLKTTLTRGKGGRKFHFFLGWLNNFVTDCRYTVNTRPTGGFNTATNPNQSLLVDRGKHERFAAGWSSKLPIKKGIRFGGDLFS